MYKGKQLEFKELCFLHKVAAMPLDTYSLFARPSNMNVAISFRYEGKRYFKYVLDYNTYRSSYKDRRSFLSFLLTS